MQKVAVSLPRLFAAVEYRADCIAVPVLPCTQRCLKGMPSDFLWSIGIQVGLAESFLDRVD